MQGESAMITKRFIELSNRAFSRGTWSFSEFLDLAGQDALARADVRAPYTLFGGYDGAERVVACFGSEDICGYTEEPPVVCIKVEPLSQKFADELSHRDFLGSLMGLGIRREVLGDIIISENCGYVFCLESIAGFITENLIQVRRTSVSCSVCDTAPDVAPKPLRREINAASERVDAVIASVYNLSRNDSQELFRQGKIFINARMCENVSRPLSAGDIVSVRGRGRFAFVEILGETRKGRMRIAIDQYGK